MRLLCRLFGKSWQAYYQHKDTLIKERLREEMVVQFVKENGGLEYAVSRLNAYVESAVGALSIFPDSVAKDSLVELAHFTAERIM